MKNKFMMACRWGFLLIAFFQTAFVYAEDDLQLWNAYKFSKQLHTQFNLFYNPGLRFRDDIGDLFYHEHRLGLGWKAMDSLKLNFNYLIGRNQNDSGAWRTENRGEIDITPSYSIGAINFSLRGRIEMQKFEGDSGTERWRFRLGPTVSRKTDILGVKATPYISNDAFYDLRQGDWNQNRVFAGSFFPIRNWGKSSLTLQVYYMLQALHRASGDWDSNHVLGTTMMLNFD